MTRLWRLSSLTATVVTSSFIVAFPYFAGAFNFNTAVVGYPLANALAVAAAYCYRETTLRAPWSWLLLIVAFALYQPALGFFLAAVITAELREFWDAPDRLWPRLVTFGRALGRWLVFCLAPASLIYIASVLAAR